MKYESKDAASHHKKLKFTYDITQKYYNKFIDPKTGKFDEKYTQLRSCPVCESRSDLSGRPPDGFGPRRPAVHDLAFGSERYGPCEVASPVHRRW